MKLLKDKILNIRCYIIGSPLPSSRKYYTEIKQYIKNNNLNSIVEFASWTDEIAKYYRELNVYVLPSTYPDPFPTVNLEAMLYHKPVIATNIGGSKEQVVDGETGFIIEPNKPEVLAEKIEYLYKNPEIAKQMGEEGHKRVTTEFTMEKYVDEHLKLYRKGTNRF